MKKRFAATLLSLIFLLSLIPAAAVALQDGETTGPQETVAVQGSLNAADTAGGTENTGPNSGIELADIGADSEPGTETEGAAPQDDAGTDSEEETAGAIAKIGDAEYTSLAEAIEKAEDGDTITIVADIALTSAVTVSDKSVTITSEREYTISGPGLTNLITVSEGAELTLSGAVIVDGTASRVIFDNSGWGYIRVKGTLTLQDEVKIQHFTIGSYGGAIYVDGENAVLNIEGGAVCNNVVGAKSSQGDYAGTIRISSGAVINMTGGSIDHNEVWITYDDEDGTISNWSNSRMMNSSSGILLYISGTINMSGGTISDNTGFRGSAINIYGFGDLNSPKELNISGDAKITNNSYGRVSSHTAATGVTYTAAGAVYLYCWGTINMSGGEISNNRGGVGGGVAVCSFWYKKAEYASMAYFNMTGGTISGNYAAGSGGGIYSYSNGVSITGGEIVNNTAANLGGGIYSEGNTYEGYGTVYLENAVIRDNTASLQGGGLWLCPTGSAEIYVTDGCAIYDNTAEYDETADYHYNDTDTALNGAAAGDDVAAGAQSDYTLTLASRILGGGSVAYYEDGRLDSATTLWPEEWQTAENPYWDSAAGTSTWAYPVVDETAGRYEAEGESEAVIVENSSDHQALKSQAEAAELAEHLASVVISGNKASYGGGIGANGGVVIGTDTSMDVTVQKVWADQEEDHPDSVTVWLTNTVDGKAYRIQSAELSDDNNWEYTFEDLPVSSTYSVEEESVAGYTYQVKESEEADNTFVITNTKTLTGSLSVAKVVSGSGADHTKQFTFTVTLDDKAVSGTYGGMTFVNGAASFTLSDGESIIAAGLPQGTAYTVTESGNDGYTVTVTVDGTAQGTAAGTIPASGTSAVVFYNSKDSSGDGGSDPEYTSLTVSKVWVLDDGGTAGEDVTVNLLRNGKAYDSATLNAANGWTKTWTRLNDSYNWTVEEADVPDGFTAAVTHRGTVWTITNDDVPNTPEEPDEPDVPVEPDVPDEPDTPNPPDEPDDTPAVPDTPDTPDVPDRQLDDVPKTGDETHSTLYLLLMLLSLTGMGVTFLTGRRLRYVGAREAKREKKHKRG